MRAASPLPDTKPRVLEDVREVVGDLLSELVPCLLDKLGTDIFTSADLPVDGTEHRIFRLRLSADLVDKQLRAALRAGGFEVAEVRHGSAPVVERGLATVQEGAPAVTAGAPETRATA